MVNRMAQGVAFGLGAFMIGVLLYWQVDLLNRGGPIMVPIVMCSVFVVAILVERLIYFNVFVASGADPNQLFEQLRGAVEARDWQKAEAVCAGSRGPVVRVAAAGLKARERSPQEIDEAMGQAAHDELPLVEQHLRWLSTLAQISTLLGLLGTVLGLVRAFQVIQTKSIGGNPVSPGDLAGGVWEALITTVAGLTVAIPTIVAYNYLAGRVGEVQFQMEKVSDLVAHWRHRGTPPHQTTHA